MVDLKYMISDYNIIVIMCTISQITADNKLLSVKFEYLQNYYHNKNLKNNNCYSVNDNNINIGT